VVLRVIEGSPTAGLVRLNGGLADDTDRRRATAIGGDTSVAMLSSLIGAATSAWQVAPLRSSAWTARGLRVPARNALLADATSNPFGPLAKRSAASVRISPGG